MQENLTRKHEQFDMFKTTSKRIGFYKNKYHTTFYFDRVIWKEGKFPKEGKSDLHHQFSMGGFLFKKSLLVLFFLIHIINQPLASHHNDSSCFLLVYHLSFKGIPS